MSLRILQLTDMHLWADPAAALKGVPTLPSFRDVLAFIESRRIEFDYAVLTGDLAHEGEFKAYETLANLLGETLQRSRVIPGNHDRRGPMRRVFGEIITTRRGPLTFLFDAGDWRMIGLDTLVPDRGAGQIEEEQRLRLEKMLAEGRSRPTAIFMHHPPISVGSEWLDRIGLEEPDGFAELVSEFSQVQLICCGHVHQDFEGMLADSVVLAAPSTALQFEPGRDQPAFSDEPPGFRIIELGDGGFKTEVIRLPELRYPPAP